MATLEERRYQDEYIADDGWVEVRLDEIESYENLTYEQQMILHSMNRWPDYIDRITALAALPRPMDEPVFVRRPPPEPVQVEKKSIPKHIADQIWELNEPDCQICLDKIKKDEYKLSPCGHHFCSRCFKDTRVDRCGECRQELTLA
jgi:hypothetical protein